MQHVTPIPKELDSAGAASILCAVSGTQHHSISETDGFLVSCFRRVSLYIVRSSVATPRSVTGSSSPVLVEDLAISVSSYYALSSSDSSLNADL